MQKIISNCGNPQGFWGRFMLNRMNKRHSELARWGIESVGFLYNADNILDAGCGGGHTIRLMLELTNARVYGVDCSDVSVKKAKSFNRKAVKNKRAQITQKTVDNLDFDQGFFDMVTAVETVYFWEPFDIALKEIYRVLRVGGKLIIINELTAQDDKPEAYAELKNAVKLNIYTEKELNDTLKAAGFVIEKTTRCGDWIAVAGVKTE